jgi:MFS family permease
VPSVRRPAIIPSERIRRLGVLGGGVFFTITGLAQPFFTLFAQELGAPAATIGLLVTLRALAPLAIALPAGQLIDQLGPVRMLTAGMAFLVASLVLTSLAEGVGLLVVSQLLLGVSVVISASSLQVLVATGEKAERNAAINRYSMWMSGGGALGPILGGLVVSVFADTIAGHRAAFAAAAVAGTAFLVLLLVTARRLPPPPAAADPARLREAFRPSAIVAGYRWGFGLAGLRPVQFGLGATFIIMYMQSFYSSFLPLLLDGFGYSALLISVVLAAHGVSAMAARFLLGAVMRHARLTAILTGAGFVAALCLLATPFAAPWPAAAIVVVCIMGAAVGLNLPVGLMIMVDAVGEGERGKLMSLRLLVNRFAQILSPAMFGALGGAFGLVAAFAGGGAFLLATMCGFTALLGRRHGGGAR